MTSAPLVFASNPLNFAILIPIIISAANNIIKNDGKTSSTIKFNHLISIKTFISFAKLKLSCYYMFKLLS